VSRLVVFDCDGTLVDSQHVIVAAMGEGFGRNGLAPPPAEAVRRVVGLSLLEAVARLHPDGDETRWQALADGYRAAWQTIRAAEGVSEPLFEGARDVLDELDRRGHLLAVATGKSRPGLDMVLAHHDLTPLFVSLQTADRHPGKPHPGMLEGAMRETGSTPEETVMVGDTTFDVEMALAAGALPIGVAWGYHPRAALERAGAATILERFDDLLSLLATPTR
jgi:phosphoglycolate phosphatase